MRRPYNRSMPYPVRYSGEDRGPYYAEDRHDERYWEVYPPEHPSGYPVAHYAPRDGYYPPQGGWEEPRYNPRDRALVRPEYVQGDGYYPYNEGYAPEPQRPSRRARRDAADMAAPRHPIQNPSDDLEDRLANLEALLREKEGRRQPPKGQQHKAAPEAGAHTRANIDGIMADLSRRLAEMEEREEGTGEPAPLKDDMKPSRKGPRSGTDFSALFDKIEKLESGLSQLSGNVAGLSNSLDHTAQKQNERLQNVRFDVDGLADRISSEVKKGSPDARWFDNIEKTVSDISRRQKELDGGQGSEGLARAVESGFSNLTKETKASTQQLEMQIKSMREMIKSVMGSGIEVNLDPIAAELQKISHKLDHQGANLDTQSISRLEEHLGTLALTMAKVQEAVGNQLHNTMRGMDGKLDRLSASQSDFTPVMDKLNALEDALYAISPTPAMEEVRKEVGRLSDALDGFSPSGDGMSLKALEAMRVDLEKLHGRINDLAPSDLSKIEQSIRDLAARMGEMDDVGNSYQNFSLIDMRLQDLGAQLGNFGENLPSAEAQKALEARLSDLIDQLGKAKASSGATSDGEFFNRLEKSIKALMDNYQETKGLITRFDRLEGGINRLIDVLAEGAMQPAPAPVASPAPAMAAMQPVMASAPVTQHVVTQPSEDISVEDEEPFTPPFANEEEDSWAPSFSSDFTPIDEPEGDTPHREPILDAIEASLREENDPHRPLEPGTRNFKDTIENDRSHTAKQGQAQPAKPQTGAAFVDQASFIHAARKAAKSANAEAQRKYQASEANKRTKPSLNTLKSGIADKKRMLIYAFAGISILVSSIILIAPVLKGGSTGTSAGTAEPAQETIGSNPAATSQPAQGSATPTQPQSQPAAQPQAQPSQSQSGTGTSSGTSDPAASGSGNNININVRPRGEQNSDAGEATDDPIARLVNATPLVTRVEAAESRRALETATAQAATGSFSNQASLDPVALNRRLSAGQADAPVSTGSLGTSSSTSDLRLPEDFGTRKLRHAVAMGQADALIEVARRYSEGEGVEQNLQRAAYWYERAAAGGSALAQYRIGSLYEKGNGVTQDIGLAKLWYQRAAEQGNAKAMHNLAVLHTRSDANTQPDFRTASQWFVRAAELGVTDSQFNLGILYGRGMGIEQSMIESYKWFSIAARKGDAAAGQKRDEIFQILSEDDRRKAMELAEKWVPQDMIEAANFIANGPDYWGMTQAEFAAMPEAERVRRAQSYLGQIGYDAGPADGVMGPRTAEAISSYKRDMGMEEAGGITLEMLEALREQASL